ncbi:hypothetical protein [Brucella intermedia]|uniref:hypothetical protein n=1 Tax=Brucella intermedia TaxID=94625 RepID=UPI00224B487B|nr:hypothetical protein [Brucella intermedia]
MCDRFFEKVGQFSLSSIVEYLSNFFVSLAIEYRVHAIDDLGTTAMVLRQQKLSAKLAKQHHGLAVTIRQFHRHRGHSRGHTYKGGYMKTYSLVAYLAYYQLTEVGEPSIYTRYSLHKNLEEIGEIEFLSHLTPRFSVSENAEVAIYAGTLAYFPTENTIASYEEEEEIHRLWFLGGDFLVECDSSIILRKKLSFSITNKYWHREIIVSGILQEESVLSFQDLQNCALNLDLNSFNVNESNFPFQKLL